MKRAVFYLLGLFVIALGSSGVILSDVGAGAWDAVFVGLAERFGFTTGTWMIITGFMVLVFCRMLTGKKINFFAFLTSFLLGLMVDFWLLFVFDAITLETIVQQWVFFALGFGIMCTGAGTYLQADFAPTPIDTLMMSVAKKTKLSIGNARLICEGFATLLGLLVGGPISVGTIIIAIFIGYGVQAAVKAMGKAYNRPLKKTT
ncbi:MAG: hypothetical protein FWF59_07155 [Turicibacter sp.]|nr:hypothetical protein [Turicibacter sp.]